jgi:hypothetical protein
VETLQYYEAVGPLPPRPGAPLWRSPSPKAAENPEAQRKKEIAAHKQQISRHRHHWSPPRTPPGYWNIGFPDTQEVARINKRAGEMHRQKLFGITMEAKSVHIL